ncbi:C39 family peptidase [Erythrobacter insulae]|uniref:C39 family peptidase n=2 Tax=Erythrobacter insulae TaxID=2584124 RepID=A0A547PBT9_9SPHN|nr:C39 family peptidase [Erythrobacter insulae]
MHSAKAGPKALAGIFALVSVLATGGCMTAPASQTPLWLGQLSQGTQIERVSVRSWKERKFDNVVRQRADFSCGAAVLATVFNHAFGYDTTEQQVLVNMLKIADPDLVREKGFSLLDMKTYAQTLGMQAEGYQVEYPKLLDLRVPMIALLDIRGYKHFVVIRAAFDDKIAIADPALGNRMMTRKAFEDAWNDVIFIVLDDRFDAEAELFNPPSPISAKRLLATHADLPAAAAAEFGINLGFDFSL